MRKAAAVALLGVMVFASLALTTQNASAFHRRTTGNQIDILRNCDQALTWNSNSPFFIRHGFVQGDWTDRTVVTPDERRGYLAPWTRFSLAIDGTGVTTSFELAYDRGLDALSKLYQRNFPTGMGGPHTFTGVWTVDASLAGGSYGTPVVVLKCSLMVLFT